MSSEPTSPFSSSAPPRFCRRCGAKLPIVANEWRCPQCGLQFDPARADTTTDQPGASRWKFWLPGFLAAVAAGTISYAVCLQGGEMGLALFVAVPVSFGALLGYATHVQTWAYAALGVITVCSVGLALVSLNCAGFFCGFTLGLIFLIPMFFGLICGVILRVVLITSGWDHRWYFRWYIWLIVALPYLGQLAEMNIPHRREIAVVQTGLTVNATPEEAWKAIMLYEDVEHAPPWLLRLALPRPVRSEGNKEREGEIVRCFYERGRLTKRISKVEKNRRLTFEVVEQHLHFERDLALKDGSFEITPLGPGQSRITLTTRYQRKLTPAFVWEPIERQVIHTLHGHVLEGMRRKAEPNTVREQPPAEPYQEPKKPPRVAQRESSPGDAWP